MCFNQYSIKICTQRAYHLYQLQLNFERSAITNALLDPCSSVTFGSEQLYRNLNASCNRSKIVSLATATVHGEGELRYKLMCNIKVYDLYKKDSMELPPNSLSNKRKLSEKEKNLQDAMVSVGSKRRKKLMKMDLASIQYVDAYRRIK